MCLILTAAAVHANRRNPGQIFLSIPSPGRLVGQESSRSDPLLYKVV